MHSNSGLQERKKTGETDGRKRIVKDNGTSIDTDLRIFLVRKKVKNKCNQGYYDVKYLIHV